MRVILILLLCLFSSCAYYNTFYNAKKYYSEAQRSKGNPDAKLDKCIEKCAKVIEYHPRSRWVDDAIFLMGKCFYEKRDYPSASRKFEELLNYFPDSPFADEATLFLGKSYLSQGEHTLAMATLVRLGDTRLKCTALFYMGESMYVTEDYEGAANKYRSLLESCPRTEYREKALENLAASLLKMAEYSTAIELYHSLLEGKLSEQERLEVSLRIGDAYLDLDEAQKALDILLKVDEELQDDQSKAEIRLKLSDCFRRLGKLDEAVQVLEEAAQLVPQSQISALSYYKQGLLHEEEYLDFEKAKEAYERVPAESRTAQVAKEAERKVATLKRIEKLRSELLEEDVENPAEIQFLIAEILLIELDKTDLAIEEYTKIVTQFQDSEYTPKAIYAMAWVSMNLKADSSTAEEHFRRLIDEHSETEYARLARKALTGENESE